MEINTTNGSLTLPCGFVLHPKLKLEEFRASDLFEIESIYNPGTPWYYHHFADGKFKGWPLGFVVCFYQSPSSGESVLTKFSFGAQCDDVWSIETWAKEAEFNRPLIIKLFGEPYRFQKNHSQWDEFPILDTCLIYQFGWGRAWCGMYNDQAGLFNPGADVQYSANFAWAHQDYRQYKKANTSIWRRIKRMLGR